MASFHNKVSLDDVEIILSNDGLVYVVDFGYCRDLTKLVDDYLSSPEVYLEQLIEDGIAHYATPFITKNGFPTPANGECWKSFVKGLKSSIRVFTNLSDEDIVALVKKLEEAVM